MIQHNLTTDKVLKILVLNLTFTLTNIDNSFYFKFFYFNNYLYRRKYIMFEHLYRSNTEFKVLKSELPLYLNFVKFKRKHLKSRKIKKIFKKFIFKKFFRKFSKKLNLSFYNTFKNKKQKLPAINVVNQKSSANSNFLINFKRYYQNILLLFFKKKTVIINQNYINFFNLKKLKKDSKHLLKYFKFLKKTRLCMHILIAIISCLKFKDTQIISDVIRKTFEKVHFSKHKAYFSLWRFLTNKIVKSYLNFFKVLGFKLVFRGKLGVGGNVKKRCYTYKLGLLSNSTKILKTNNFLGNIRTKTGVVGFKISIFY